MNAMLNTVPWPPFSDAELRDAMRTIECAGSPSLSLEELAQRMAEKRMPIDHPAVAHVLALLKKPSCLRSQPCGTRKVCRDCERFYFLHTPAGRAAIAEPGTLAALRKSVSA